MSTTPEPDRLTKMIQAQNELQLRLGLNFRDMSDASQVDEIRIMVLACTAELHEAMMETSWKPWTSGGAYINRREAFGELRDAWQFLTNLMLIVSEDRPADLADRLYSSLMEKLPVNYDRAATGYDGVKDKCPACRRAIGDIVVKEVIVNSLLPHVNLYCVCGYYLGARAV